MCGTRQNDSAPRLLPAPRILSGVFFDQETFGADKLAVGLGDQRRYVVPGQTPLSESARTAIVQIQEGAIDYLPGLSSDDKKQRLSRISYEAFLRDLVHVEPAVLNYYHARPMGEWGVGTDAVSALDCWGFGLPGFQGMKLAKGSIRAWVLRRQGMQTRAARKAHLASALSRSGVFPRAAAAGGRGCCRLRRASAHRKRD